MIWPDWNGGRNVFEFDVNEVVPTPVDDERRRVIAQARGGACRTADDPTSLFQRAQDVLPLGVLDLGKRTTNFTPGEQRTLLTLWSIAHFPLIMGGLIFLLGLWLFVSIILKAELF